MYHSKTWGIWVLAALVPILLTKNPFYLLIAMLAVGTNYLALSRDAPASQGWATFLRLGVILVAFSIVLNLLFVSAGHTVLFELPELRWRAASLSQQPVLIRVGGRVTLESLIYGLTTGLALVGVLVTFATFNSLVDHYQLLRSIPRFLYQSAIIASIGITFVPHMVVAQQEIREAQALRGHRFRAIADLPPLFVALLAEGLERSITLAESMDARGFGGPPASAVQNQAGEGGPVPTLLLKSIIALALVILAGGAFGISYFPDPRIGAATMSMGVLMLAAALWVVGQSVRRSRYQRAMWRPHDTLVAGASLLAGAVMIGTWLVDRAALVFYPYPRLYWPAFSLWIALALLLLAAPAVVHWMAREPAVRRHAL
jgi:energy-coupling factor transport system permease protein